MFCALLLALMPMRALAAEGDAVIARNDNIYIESIFVDGDTLYLKGDRLYTYHIGDADMTACELEPELSDFCEEGESVGYDGLIFADGGTLYSINHIMRYGESSSRVTGTVLSEVEIGSDGTAALVNSREIRWPEELVEIEGRNSYPMTPQNLFARDGVLYFFVYGNAADQAYALKLESMELVPIQTENLQSMLPYADGKVLLHSYNYTNQAVLETYDPVTGRTEKLCEIANDYGGFSGLACSADTGEVYCVMGGEIHPVNLTAGTVGEGVADMPLTVFSNRSGCMLGDYYVYAADEGVIIRSTKPAERPTRRIKVCDSHWLNGLMDTYFDFTNIHGDVSVSVSRDYNDRKKLVEDMMNRQDNVDIYILNIRDGSYDALLQRGYMAELDGSEKLTAELENVYPSIRDVLTRDGHVVAVPVGAYCWSLGVNERALARIGLTSEDVPTNWMDFLDFLADKLPQHLTPESGVDLIYEGMSAKEAKWSLFSEIFTAYNSYVTTTMDVPEYDTELLRALMEKLERVDFTAFGLTDAEEDASGRVFSAEYHDDQQLFDFNIGISFGNFYTDYTPIVMSMDENTPAILPLELYAAFINPFSQEQELCVEFLEMLMDNLGEEVRYNFCPDLTEPIRRPDAEEYLKYEQEYYEDMKKRYEEADEADKQALEEQLRQAEKWLERAERDSWLISAEQIEWFRANDDDLVAEGNNWLYADSSGEAYELMMQYLQGQIDARQFLQGVEKKARMMQMEGN